MNEEETKEILDRWKDAKKFWATWKSETRKAYDFVASRQWDEQDVAQLNEEDRPALTFNRAEVFVDAIVGNEINSRQTIKYFPRGMDQDVQISEIMNGSVKWVRDGCNAAQEESDSFRDCVICGLGVTETRMDYEEESDGKVIQERKDPLLYWPDPSAKKQCLEDRRYDFYGEWIDRDHAKELWPDAEFSQTHQIWDEPSQPHDNDPRHYYEDESFYQDEKKNQVLILKYECVKRMPFYKVADPESGKVIEVEYKRFKKIAEMYKNNDLNYVKMTKKVYYRAFLAGEEILESTKSPVQCFTRQIITGKRDRNKNTWYGIVRVMMDPQKWANKFLSSVLSIIGQNAKGGAFYETNVFVDQRQAEEDWAKNAPLIEVGEGALSQGKIRERVAPPVPAGLERLMSFSFESMPFVTGINLEALGLANRTQAGVLETQRRKAAFGIIAPLFESLRRYRKNQGQVLMEFIREFISDGRLVRVIGDTGDTKMVPLAKQQMSLEYDINIDESPDSPDFKEKTWEILSQMIPTMLKIGYPIPPELWSFSPLPTSVSQSWIKAIKEGPQIPPKIQEQMKQMEQELKKLTDQNQQLEEENTKMKVDGSLELMKTKQDGEIRLLQLAQKSTESDKDQAIRRFEALAAASSKETEAKIRAATDLLVQKAKSLTEAKKLQANLMKELTKIRSDQQISMRDRNDLSNAMNEKTKEVGEMVKNLSQRLEKLDKPTKRQIKRVKGGFEIVEGDKKRSIKRIKDGFEIN